MNLIFVPKSCPEDIALVVDEVFCAKECSDNAQVYWNLAPWEVGQLLGGN